MNTLDNMLNDNKPILVNKWYDLFEIIDFRKLNITLAFSLDTLLPQI
jgi:hypothetical protein